MLLLSKWLRPYSPYIYIYTAYIILICSQINIETVSFWNMFESELRSLHFNEHGARHPKLANSFGSVAAGIEAF